MGKIKTLNSLRDLRDDSEFGRPSPRNGLNLLYWFATQCVAVDDNNTVTIVCKPSQKDFGFEWFHNSEGLFPPETGLTYYEVGNLHHDKKEELPDYVKKKHNSPDRIVVGIRKRRGRLTSVVESVYVTSHDDQRNFDPEKTYLITTQLLRIISNYEREDFVAQIVPQRCER